MHWLKGTLIRDFLYLVFHQKSPRNYLLHGLKPVRIRYSLNLRRNFITKPITRCDPRRRFDLCRTVCSPPPHPTRKSMYARKHLSLYSHTYRVNKKIEAKYTVLYLLFLLVSRAREGEEEKGREIRRRAEGEWMEYIYLYFYNVLF